MSGLKANRCIVLGNRLKKEAMTGWPNPEKVLKIANELIKAGELAVSEKKDEAAR